MSRQHSISNETERRIGNRPIRRRHVGGILGAFALVVTLTACGGDDDDTPEDADEAMEDIEEGLDDAVADVTDAVEEAGEDAVELAVRNLASIHGADEFDDAGHPLDGDLTCTADASADLTAVELSCTGATEDGRAASMTGTTSEFPGESVTELEGDFVGLVDDEEVFRTDALG